MNDDNTEPGLTTYKNKFLDIWDKKREYKIFSVCFSYS